MNVNKYKYKQNKCNTNKIQMGYKGDAKQIRTNINNMNEHK